MPTKIDLRLYPFWARAAYQDKQGEWHWVSPEPRCTATLFIGESGYMLLERDCFHALILADCDVNRAKTVHGTYKTLETYPPA